MVITRMNAHDNWRSITLELEKSFEVMFSVYHLMDDKALLPMEDGRFFGDIGKWKKIGAFHVKIEQRGD